MMLRSGLRAGKPVLQVESVCKTYPNGVRALDQVSLEVDTGETLALIGESGSGKSTLLKLFNRLVEPTSGSVSISGCATQDWDPIELRRCTGYVQQEGGLLPHWSVQRNVELVPRLLDWEPERRQTRAREMLELVGLPADEFADRLPQQLSGGQRQRVAFARAWAADPKVVLLDEPFGALDALTRARLQREFQELQTRTHKTMVLVTHDLDEAFLLADRIAVMQSGRILQWDTAAGLESAPQHAYVAELLELRRRRS